MRSSRDAGKSQAGVTLVELLVVLTLTGVIGSMVTIGVVRALESARHSQARVAATQELELGGQRIVRELRVAQELILAGDESDDLDSVPFQSRIGAQVLRDGVESEIEFFIDDSTSPARLLSSSTATGDQVLITLVNLDATDPVFRYLDSRGNEIPCDTSTSCAASYAGAARVEVVLRRDVGEGRPPITYRTQAAIRNLRYGTSE